MRAWRKVIAAYTAAYMTLVTCRMTAMNRDQLRNPTLGSRVWATFVVFVTVKACSEHMNRTELTCNKSTQLYDAFI